MGRARGESWKDDYLVSFPSRANSAVGELTRRAIVGLGIILLVTIIVWLDRDGYSDNTNGDGLSFIDALYYATITVSTTGYGDITPVTWSARLFNAVLITPLRVAFLILLVGTTLEVLASEGRRAMRDNRWRKRMRNHSLIFGYGTKGRSAARTLLTNGVDAARVLVVDERSDAIRDANRAGLAALQGSAVSREVLERAEIRRAREIIITLDRDDTAILATLRARQINPKANIIVAVQDEDNAALARQSGANNVITSSDAVGRILGMSAVSPTLGNVLEDVLSTGEGIELVQRPLTKEEIGIAPADIRQERVVAVVRHGEVRRFFERAVQQLEGGDELIVIRRSEADLLAERERSLALDHERG